MQYLFFSISYVIMWGNYDVVLSKVPFKFAKLVLWPRGGSGKSLGASRSWCFWVEQTLQNHNQLGVLATPLCFSLNSRWRMAAILKNG